MVHQKLLRGAKETHQEDQTMQEQGVEERDGPGHFIGQNHTTLRDTKTRGLVSKLHQTQSVCVCLCV